MPPKAIKESGCLLRTFFELIFVGFSKNHRCLSWDFSISLVPETYLARSKALHNSLPLQEQRLLYLFVFQVNTCLSFHLLYWKEVR